MIYPNFIKKRVDFYKNKTLKTANDTLDTALKLATLILVTFTIVWISIFLYVAFYYTAVPAVQHVRPMHLQFHTPEDKDINFPTAHVQLTKSNQILMVGQQYRVLVELEMPESPSNLNLGVFMICGRLAGKGGVVVSHSCRSTMLRYNSFFVRTLKIITFAPLYIFGTFEEKQNIVVELFSHHEEDQSYPATDFYIEIKTNSMEIYSAKLYVNAHLVGISYIMFNYPILSAAFGISFNLCVIMFIALLSWWQLSGSYLKGRNYLYEKLKGKFSPESSKNESEDEGSDVKRIINVGGPTDDSDAEEFMGQLKELDVCKLNGNMNDQ